jgi:hypothetical protein
MKRQTKQMPKETKSPGHRLPVPVELIERRIYLIRGHKVMLDADLADLYQVTTGNLNLAVRRNSERFRADFMFQLTKEETGSLLLRIARAKTGRGGRQTSPYAFTEQGVSMLSSVLRSKRAIQVNIAIMRAFVKLREILATHKDVAHKLAEIERTQEEHSEHISEIWQTIQKLIEPPEKPKRRIGFHAEDQ